MKRSVLLAGLCSVSLWACTEKAPNIIMTPPPDRVDTTYVESTLPAAQPHNILIENFTGATCSNCPAAHDVLHSLETTYPNRINLVSLYINNFAQTTPPEHAKYDFRSEIATDILKGVYTTIAAMPTAGIDRLPLGDASSFGSAYLIGSPSWSSIISTRIGVTDSVNLDLSSVYDSSSRTAKITVKVTYLENLNTTQNVTIGIVEDSFVDIQEFPPPVKFDTAYEFNNILRGVATAGAMGDAILPTMTTKEKGRVYLTTYNYKVNAAWKPKNCRVVAYVHRGAGEGGKLIYQSQQAKLAP